MSAPAPVDEEALLAKLRARLDPLDAPEGAPKRSDFDLNIEGAFDVAGLPAPTRGVRRAAVLAPIVRRAGGLNVILTVRAGHLSSHAGQIAFPGGRIDDADESAAHAALREAHEEIGLKPDLVELIGGFDAYETVTRFRIRPYVGLVRDPAFLAVPDPSEVEAVFEAPLGFLLDPGNFKKHWKEWEGVRRYYYAAPFGDKYIWGATAGMLKALADRMSDD